MTSTLHADLQTLAARWGDWKPALRAVGADAMDIRALQFVEADMYYVPTKGRANSIRGYVAKAMALPVCTFADLATLTTRPMGRFTLTSLLRAYAETGGKLKTPHGVLKARRTGKVTPEMVRFLSFCANYS
jgi:hypothetical protein